MYMSEAASVEAPYCGSGMQSLVVAHEATVASHERLSGGGEVYCCCSRILLKLNIQAAELQQHGQHETDTHYCANRDLIVNSSTASRGTRPFLLAVEALIQHDH